MTATPKICDFSRVDKFAPLVSDAFGRAAVRAARRERAEQGLPRKITDPAVVGRLAGLLKRGSA